ncbi:DUF4349 domain-containing protein [Paenibacillus marinisediminis]
MHLTEREERSKTNHSKAGRHQVWFKIVWPLILITVLVSGCGAVGSSEKAAISNNSAHDTAAMPPRSEEAKAEMPREMEVSDQSGNAIGQTAGGIVEAPTQMNRKLIYKANLVMEVKGYEEAKQRINDIVHLAGGYTLQYNDQVSEYERGGTFVFKVPSSGFQSVLDQINKLEHLRFERSYSANDVTEEYVDLESRLKARRVNESRLLSYMEKATTTEDLLELSNQLAAEQEVIEQIVGRMRYLDNNVEMSTIELRMYETVKAPKQDILTATFGEKISSTLKDSLEALLAVVQGVILIIVALAPFLIVILLLAIPVWLIIRRNRHNRQAAKTNRHQAFNLEAMKRNERESQQTVTEQRTDRDDQHKGTEQ